MQAVGKKKYYLYALAFPLLVPFILSFFHGPKAVFGSSLLEVVNGSILFAWTPYLISLLLFWRLVRSKTGSQIALRAWLLALLFPLFAGIVSSVYTEIVLVQGYGAGVKELNIADAPPAAEAYAWWTWGYVMILGVIGSVYLLFVRILFAVLRGLKLAQE